MAWISSQSQMGQLCFLFGMEYLNQSQVLDLEKGLRGSFEKIWGKFGCKILSKILIFIRGPSDAVTWVTSWNREFWTEGKPLFSWSTNNQLGRRRTNLEKVVFTSWLGGKGSWCESLESCFVFNTPPGPLLGGTRPRRGLCQYPARITDYESYQDNLCRYIRFWNEMSVKCFWLILSKGIHKRTHFNSLLMSSDKCWDKYATIWITHPGYRSDLSPKLLFNPE